MQEIWVPAESLVVVCGASCSGKTTLAQRIVQAVPAPQADKCLYSLDVEYAAAMSMVPALRSYAERMAAGDFLDERELPAEAYSQWKRVRSERLADVLLQKRIVIYDGILVSRDGLRKQLLGMLLVRDMLHPRSPLVLIKMSPTQELHREFYRERQRKRDNCCLPPNYALEQRSKFETQVAPYNFTEQFRTQRECHEYIVSDPREVTIVIP